MNSKELREKRGGLAARIKELADKVNGEQKRDFTAEEKANWEALNADYNAMTQQITVAERAEAIDAEQRTVVQDIVPGLLDRGSAAKIVPPSQDDEARAIAGWMASQTGRTDLVTEETIESARRCNINLNRPELVLRFGEGLKRAHEMQKRALTDTPQTVTTTGGGYAVPTGFVAQLEKSMLEYSPLEPLYTPLITSSGETINQPTLDDTSNAGEMVGINSTISNAALTFGTFSLGAFKGSSKLILVPFELLQDSAINMTQLLAESIGERLGRLKAAQLTTGADTTAPQGIITGSSSAATTASATAVTTDEILTLIHSIDPAYRQSAFNCGFEMNDGVLLAVRKLKDGNGQYIWQPSAQAGQPDMLFGWPVYINQNMAASCTATYKTILFGALSKFVVRTVGEIRIKRMVERFGEYDQEGWVGFIRFDSGVKDAGTDPIKYLTQHS